MKKFNLILSLIFLLAQTAHAKIDLVTLPERDGVQLTIYNSADLTLAREKRHLTLKEGFNKLQFSWANTFIDPTSLEMTPAANKTDIDVYDLSFPPRTNDLGLWNIRSKISTDVPVEIEYLTSGLSWRAFYMGTLNEDETHMQLKGFVRVINNSGEDYENAQVRLIVGNVHMVDEIVTLAQREYPYDRPGYYPISGMLKEGNLGRDAKLRMSKSVFAAEAVMTMPDAQEPKRIVKEGLSEYFLYTIEGRETIPNGFSKRLPSFTAEEVPVMNLYKYEEERYGRQVIRFLSFKNDADHKLGDTPIPGGAIKVFRNIDQAKSLSYEGQSQFKYIPIDEDVELNLGTIETVLVKPTLMDYETTNYRFDKYKNIDGWDEVREFKIEVNNTRNVPAKVEIKRNFSTTKWKIVSTGDHGDYEKIDADTVKYTLELKPNEKKEFTYTLTTYHGTRADG